MVVQAVRFRNERGQSLAGLMVESSTDAGVVFAHGFIGDKTSRGRFARIAEALQAAGIASLAFDFAGCGESDDDTLTAAKQTADLKAAMAFARADGFRRLGLFGQSLGGLISLRASGPGVTTMVLAGAITGPVQYDWRRYFSPEQMAGLQRTGRLTIPLTDGPRAHIVVERCLLEDFAAINPPELLSRVRCPVLLIHGDGDDEERLLLERSRAALEFLPAGSRLDVIGGAVHNFLGHVDDLVERTRAWMVAHLIPR